MRGVKNFNPVEGIAGHRNVAAAVLSHAIRDREGLVWLASRDADMRWWCDVAGVNVDHLVERLASEPVQGERN